MIKECSTATSGSGAYAFVSKSGAELLFGDVEFERLFDRGNYQLIVGIDQITSTEAINRLKEFQDRYASLSIYAFLHNTNNSLFHPKISYFSREDGLGSLVIGSGNLTAGGLRKNRETFAVVNLTEQEFINIDAYWNDWITQSAAYLKPLEDDDVIAKVAANTIRARAWKDISIPEIESTTAEEVSSDSEAIDESQEWKFQESSTVLFAEIPRSGNRWNQANFDVGTFESFFGATAGDNSQRILLRNAESDRVLGDIEIRPSVSVRSLNYRFELEAAAGLAYPATGRPIGIFIRLSTRMFIYRIFMPHTGEKYNEIVDWMRLNWQGRSDRMMRIVKEARAVTGLLEGTALHSFFLEQ